jgi:hypothetical protein
MRFALALLATCIEGHAQSASPTASAPDLNPTHVVEAEVKSQDLSPAITKLQDQIANSETSIRDEIARVKPTWWERLVPALLGLVGVLVGGGFGAWQQRRQMTQNLAMQQTMLKENERVEQAKVAYESLSKLIDYQTRQINEFYSPLRLMLRRSAGVRRQLCDQLNAKCPTRFVYVKDEEGRDHLFVAKSIDAYERFRLIEHMHEVATKYKELLPLIEEIVSIGTVMSDLIHTKGGMAIAGSDKLTDLLGHYLAHFSILRDVAKKATTNPETLVSLEYNVTYPVDLDAALTGDIQSLNGEIEDWKTLARQMWHHAKMVVPQPSRAA